MIFTGFYTLSITVKEVLYNILTGRWSFWLPSFQRSFVWDSDDIKQLFESMTRGLPIGVLMLWSPKNQDVDPFCIPVSPPFISQQRGERYLIIDGQQRIVSILLAVSGWALRLGPYEISREPISLNLSKLQFEIGKKGADISEAMGALLEWRRPVYTPLQERYGQEGYEKLKGVAQKLLDYRLAFYVLRTEDEGRDALTKMAELFILANRAGQRISNVELMLSYAAGALIPEVSKIIRHWYDKLQSRCRVLDVQPIIRFGFGVGLGLKQREIDQTERFKEAIKKLSAQQDVYGRSVLYHALEDALPYFETAIELIQNLIGEAAAELLPSQLSIITVASFLKSRSIKDIRTINSNDYFKIRKWLILVNFHGYYSTSPSTRLQKDLETILSASSATEPFPFNELRSNIQKAKGGASIISKSHIERGLTADLTKRTGRSYLFLLYAALCANEATDWTGIKLSSLPLHKLHKHHIFQRELFREGRLLVDEEEFVSGIGNITLINPSVNEEIKSKDPSEYLNEIDQKDLDQHFIPRKSELWNIENFEDFCKERAESIYRYLARKMPEIVEK